jgi:hypothetical protein
MRIKLFTIFSFIIFITQFFCGCNEMQSSTVETNENIQFESDIVELVESDLIFNKKGDTIKRVEVKYRFRNLLNDKIDIQVFVEFYNENTELISKEGPKEISLSTDLTFSPKYCIIFAPPKLCST